MSYDAPTQEVFACTSMDSTGSSHIIPSGMVGLHDTRTASSHRNGKICRAQQPYIASDKQQYADGLQRPRRNLDMLTLFGLSVAELHIRAGAEAECLSY